MQTWLFISLLLLAIIIELIFVPKFLVAQRPGICIKSFCFKMICATMFVATGFLCYRYSGNTSEFAKHMLIGLCLGWVGDVFLHIKPKKEFFFAIGFCFFFSSHILYLIAFSKASKQYLQQSKAATIISIALIAIVIFGSYLYIKFKKKMKMNLLTAPLCFGYGLVLVPMMVNAFMFSVQYIAAGYPNAIWGGICLTLGGISFYLSDFTIAFLMFNEADKGNIPLKNFNIGTYFFAQTMLALSILFIGG
ncbi:MAG: hypothetical protein IJZ35_06080 [Clostridia bacterium]|nr:hypothetical protein [Clostridia bacterium]